MSFVIGIFVGMLLAIVVQIAVCHRIGKSFKLKKKKKVVNDVVIEEPKLTAEEKFDKFCQSYKEEEEMAFVDSVIDFCQGK